MRGNDVSLIKLSMASTAFVHCTYASILVRARNFAPVLGSVVGAASHVVVESILSLSPRQLTQAEYAGDVNEKGVDRHGESLVCM
jgi:hypothetical protein